MENLLAAGSLLSMSTEAADRLLMIGNGDAALLYLSMLRPGSSLAWDHDRVCSAFDTLRRADLVAADTPLPNLTSPRPPEEEQKPATPEEQFSQLCDQVEAILGVPLSTRDLIELNRMKDDIHMPLEVIRILVRWMSIRFRYRYGEGRTPYLSTIRREAWSWNKQGLMTVPKAEAYVREGLRMMEREKAVRVILGIRSRPLASIERHYLEVWDSLGFDDGAIAAAKEITMQRKGVVSLDYMSGILHRWHREGLHTGAQIRVREGKRLANLPPDPETIRQQEEDMRRDIDEMRALMRKLQNEEASKR